MNDRHDERIDELVRAADRRAVERTEPDDVTAARDREAVLERIARPGKPEDRPMPWWRVVAPVAIAAGLAGLFLMRDATTPGPTAPSEPVARSEEVTAKEASPDPARRSETAELLRERVAGRPVPAPTVPAEGSADAPSTAALRVADGPESARVTVVDPAARETATILEMLGPADAPLPLATTVRDSLLERLRTLRPRLSDPERIRAIDAWIAPRE